MIDLPSSRVRGRSTLSDEPSQAVLVATVAALAGVRSGDRVAAVGIGRRTARALLAMAQTAVLVEADADVAVAASAADVADAVDRLAPGGRLVAVAADEDQARRAAAARGLQLGHTERVGSLVAWTAVRRADRTVS